MEKFELRFLERETGKILMDEHGFYYPETKKILQQRYKFNVIDYKILLDDGEYLSNDVWSEWKDIPTVKQGE